MTAALSTCAGNAATLILCYIKGGADAPPLNPTFLFAQKNTLILIHVVKAYLRV